MKPNASRSLWMTLILLGLGAAAALAQAGKTLILNGKIASNNVRLIAGRPYVPLADVAKALGQTVIARPNGYEIVTAGGANQIEGRRGKIGDVLFDGKWRFQALEVKEADAYTMKTGMDTDYALYSRTADFDTASRVFRPKPGSSLVVLRCRVKNGLKQNQALYCVVPFTRTALTNDQGESYPPIGYDMEGAVFQSKPLLPGASLDFAVPFAVPKGTTLKDLIFTLRTIEGGLEKGNDVRISLTQ